MVKKNIKIIYYFLHLEFLNFFIILLKNLNMLKYNSSDFVPKKLLMNLLSNWEIQISNLDISTKLLDFITCILSSNLSTDNKKKWKKFICKKVLFPFSKKFSNEIIFLENWENYPK